MMGSDLEKQDTKTDNQSDTGKYNAQHKIAGTLWQCSYSANKRTLEKMAAFYTGR